jgi:hypothetical protein
VNCFSGFRTDFLKAISVISNSPSKGAFIDGCYSHCQTGIQETWMRSDSPVLAKTVSHCIYFPPFSETYTFSAPEKVKFPMKKKKLNFR